MNDPLLQRLHDLPQATLDPARAERIRARCRTALAHRPRRIGTWGDVTDLWAPMAAGLAGLYLTEVVHQAIAIYGL